MAITLVHKDGQLVKNAQALHAGDSIQLQLADGTLSGPNHTDPSMKKKLTYAQALEELTKKLSAEIESGHADPDDLLQKIKRSQNWLTALPRTFARNGRGTGKIPKRKLIEGKFEIKGQKMPDRRSASFTFISPLASP